MTSIPDDLFAGAPELTYVYVLHNAYPRCTDASTLPGVSCKCRALSGGEVSSLSTALFNPLTKVTTLALSDFYVLDNLPSRAFETMSALEHLYLNDVAVGELFSETFFGLSNLKWLYVTGWCGQYLAPRVHDNHGCKGASRHVQVAELRCTQRRIEERPYVGVQPATPGRHLQALD